MDTQKKLKKRGLITDRKTKTQSTSQTEPAKRDIETQTKLSIEVHEIYEYCVSQVDRTDYGQKETQSNEKLPAMKSNSTVTQQ